MPYLEIEKKTPVAWITLSNPETLNALSRAAMGELEAAFADLEGDIGILLAVLTGAGKAFVAGADISEMRDMTADQARDFAAYGQSVLLKIERSRVVTIAAVNGFALGGGMELAMACDIRVASTKAKLGQPELKLGVTPGFGGTQRLARIAGVGRAKAMIFTGDPIDAETALSWGLVSAIYEPEELLAKAGELAGKVAAMGPTSLAQAKKAVDEGYGTAITDGYSLEADAFAACFTAGEAKEGMSAFLEKRAPKW